MTTNATLEHAAPTYDGQYSVRNLKPHPKNPRRVAIADPEMVASIKEHGILEPIVIAADGTIIMGHCRTDGAKKAKLATVPVIIRPDLDTPAKQLEVMLVENLHRTNLSELEEAESFELFKELGYTQKDIATKVGRSVKLVGDRLKLLRLSKKSQDALHKGQLTIADALAIAEFDDDPKLQDALAKKSGYQLQQSIERERRDRKAMVEIAQRVAEYSTAGVPEHKVKAGTRRWDLNKPDAMLLENTHPGRRPQSHKKCMAYVLIPSSEWYSPSIELVCTNPKGHKKPGLTKAQLADKARQQKADAERKEAELARDSARTGRVASLLELVGPGIKFDDRFADALRVLVPSRVYALSSRKTADYFNAVDQADELRWRNVEIYNRNLEDLAAYGRFVKMISTSSHQTLGRALLALLAVAVESDLGGYLPYEHRYTSQDEPGLRARLDARVYFGFLDGIGHDFTDVDQELHAAAKWAPEPVATDDQVDDQADATTSGDEE